MRKIIILGICIILMAVAFAEPVLITFTDPASGDIFNSTIHTDKINVTLPGKVMSILVENELQNFSLTTSFVTNESIPLQLFPRLYEPVNILSTTHNLGPGSLRYEPKLSYAISFNTTGLGIFTIQFNYSGVVTNINNENNLVVFEFDFNSTDNSTGYVLDNFYTAGTGISSGGSLTVNTTANTATFTTTNLSLFVLAEDTGSTTSSGSGSSSGGSGGGGGGGSRGITAQTITLSETPAIISLRKGQTLFIINNGNSYRFKQDQIFSGAATIKNLDTFKSTSFLKGVAIGVDLDGVYGKDMEVIMVETSGRTVTYSLKKIGGKQLPSLMDLLPSIQPKSRVVNKESTVEKVVPTTPTPSPVRTPLAEPIEKESSFMAILITIVGGLLLAVLLIVLFVKRRPIEKIVSVDLAPKITQDIIVPEERKLEMEKFIYHKLQEGYTKDNIHEALLTKGWPEEEITIVFENIAFTDEHIEKENLHTHNDIEYALEPVKRLMEKGFDEEHIRQALKRKGWNDEDITKIFKRI